MVPFYYPYSLFSTGFCLFIRSSIHIRSFVCFLSIPFFELFSILSFINTWYQFTINFRLYHWKVVVRLNVCLKEGGGRFVCVYGFSFIPSTTIHHILIIFFGPVWYWLFRWFKLSFFFQFSLFPTFFTRNTRFRPPPYISTLSLSVSLLLSLSLMTFFIPFFKIDELTLC